MYNETTGWRAINKQLSYVATTVSAIIAVASFYYACDRAHALDQADRALDQARRTIETRDAERNRCEEERTSAAAVSRQQLETCQDTLSTKKAELVEMTSRQKESDAARETHQGAEGRLAAQLEDVNSALVACRLHSSQLSSLFARDTPSEIGIVDLKKGTTSDLSAPDIALRFEKVDNGMITLVVDSNRRYGVPVDFASAAVPVKFDQQLKVPIGVQFLTFLDSDRRSARIRLVRFPPTCGVGPPGV